MRFQAEFTDRMKHSQNEVGKRFKVVVNPFLKLAIQLRIVRFTSFNPSGTVRLWLENNENLVRWPMCNLAVLRTVSCNFADGALLEF